MIFERKNWRLLTAVLLTAGGFLTYPLAFLRLSGRPVPLYNLVQFLTMPEYALCFLGAAALFPENLKRFFRTASCRFLLLSAGVYFLVPGGFFAAGKITFDELLSAWAILFIPLGIIALADEFRRILPFFGVAGAVLLLISGFTSENFTGLTGNWNWTMGSITALLPLASLFFPEKYQSKISLALLGCGFLAAAVFARELFPRSAFAGAVATLVMLGLRRKMPQKNFDRFLLISGGTVGVLAVIVLLTLDLDDTRYQIWKGAWEMIMANPATGVGPGKFSEFIREYLFEEYYFTAYPAAHIDHAHNDLLNIFAQCGIAGALFYIAAVFAVWRKRPKSPVETAAYWLFGIMFFCGIFDQHNLAPGGFFIFALGAALSLAPRAEGKTEPLPWPLGRCSGIAAGAVLWGMALFMMITNYSATTRLRQGDLKLLSGDLPGAKQDYSDSIREKPTFHGLYQLAQLALAEGKTASYPLEKLETELKIRNCRHTRRLRAVNAYMQRDFATAFKEMEVELLQAPTSIISADFQRHLLRDSGVRGKPLEEAEERFLALCRLRQVAPEEIYAPHFAVIDDSPLPGRR